MPTSQPSSEQASFTARSTTTPRPSVVVVGAGLAGSMMSIYLARAGYRVEVYERRADLRRTGGMAGRSINLGLTARGLRALRRAGLDQHMLDRAVVMHGRAVHALDGTVTYHAYGKDPSEALNSIDRTELNRVLLDAAEATGHVRVHFQQRCVEVDKDTRTLKFHDEEQETEHTVHADLLIGADGAFSTVREHLHAGIRADFHQEYLPWGYKELTLPAAPDGSSQIQLDALHVWPRGDALIVTHSNRDGSHTVTLFMPFAREHGRFCFDDLRQPEDVQELFDTYFPDLVPLMPELVDQFFSHPVGRLVTVRTAPWYHEDWAVLIGDAVHAVFPFYGQGMNAALEDCVVLDELLQEHLRAAAQAGKRVEADFGRLLRNFQERRKVHTDTLAELSKQNFLELSQRLQSLPFLLRKKADVWLNRLFPDLWKPLYGLVAHTTMPYADAVARAEKQKRILRGLGLGAALLALLSLLRKR